MNVKESVKIYCLYCKKILFNPKEIELNYHFSCKKEMDEFEKADNDKIGFFSNMLSVPENLTLRLLKKGDIKYILDKNKNFKELKIISLAYFTGFGLNGNLIKAVYLPINELQELQVLAISFNYDWSHDDGWWKGDLTEIQENIGELKNLEILDLSGNRIKKLPDSIGDLTNLKVLHLQGNDLTVFPNNITKLTNLETLNLNDNKLYSLPIEMSDLGNLKSLGIDEENILSFSEFGDTLANLEELTIYPYYQARMLRHIREANSFKKFPKQAQICLKKLKRNGCTIKHYP